MPVPGHPCQQIAQPGHDDFAADAFKTVNATHQHHHWRIGCLAAEVNPVDRKVNVFQRNPRERLHSNLSRRFRQHTLKTNHLRQKGSQQMALAAIPTGLFGRNSRMGVSLRNSVMGLSRFRQPFKLLLNCFNSLTLGLKTPESMCIFWRHFT